jgi:hypothetical protein
MIRLAVPFSSFCKTTKSVPSTASITISPSTMAELALMCQASSATFLKRPGPVVAAPREDVDGFVGEVDLHAVAVQLDLVNPSLGRRHSVARRCGRLLQQNLPTTDITPLSHR